MSSDMSGVLEEVVEGFEPSPELVSIIAGTKRAMVLGLDIGTSGVRATLFDDKGFELPGATVRTTRAFRETSSFSVIDPETLIDLVVDTIDLLLVQQGVSFDQVELISISCFWHSLMGVDDKGLPTTSVFGWADTRAATTAQELRERFDETEAHLRTGCRFHPSYWPAKLLWLRTEQPRTFQKTSQWLSFSEYLALRLFGETTISVSMASGTGFLNQRSCEWDESLSNSLEISAEKFPKIAQSTITEARLTPQYAVRWPQLSGAVLCPAIADGAANNIGAGCTTLDKIALMIGTSGAMRVLYEGEPPTTLPLSLWSYRADRLRVVVGGALSDGGGLYQWLRELMLSTDDTAAIENTLGEIDPDEHGLTILPFWAGERSTGWSLNARGGIFGVTLDTKPIEILRAAMEAVAYRFALILRDLDAIAPEASIVAAGNALESSPVWTQILADVLGRQISLRTARESSARGAALLALEAAGKISSIDNVTNDIERIFEPDAARYSIYQKAILRQQRFYDSFIGSLNP
jgi:gluconokinase